jgi:hypothetical protein
VLFLNREINLRLWPKTSTRLEKAISYFWLFVLFWTFVSSLVRYGNNPNGAQFAAGLLFSYLGYLLFCWVMLLVVKLGKRILKKTKPGPQ